MRIKNVITARMLRMGRDLLTDHEADIATLAAAGRGAPEIAEALGLHPSGVRAALSMIYDRLGGRIYS